MVVAAGNNYGVFSNALSLSGGGVTTWNQWSQYEDIVSQCNSYTFWGEITATGSQSLSVVSSGGPVAAIAQEFNPSSTVAVDTINGATSTGTSGSYPPVTPSGANELYGGVLLGDSPLGGSSGGFTYVASPNIGAQGSFLQFVYSIGPTGSTSPPWTSGSTTYFPERFLASGFLTGGSPPPPPGYANQQMIL